MTEQSKYRLGLRTRLERWLFVAVLVMQSVLVPAAHAVQPDEILADPALEARARSISAGLRCLVCQNQSIDDSDAPLARDLRVLVRERLTAGDSDADVREYIVARYGDFVLLKPPLKPETFLLWVMPAVALALALWASLQLFRRASEGSQMVPAKRLSAEEEEKLTEILAAAPPEGGDGK